MTAVRDVSLSVIYNEHFYTTLLVTPADLEDFAIGFSLSEGVITRKSQIVALEVAETEAGLLLKVTLEDGIGPPTLQPHTQGHVNCFCMLGMRSSFRCESTTLRKVQIAPGDLEGAFDTVSGANARAAFWRSGQGACLVREDEDGVNAFDKLAGALATADVEIDRGLVAVSSAASIDLVNKAAAAGAIAIAVRLAPKAPVIGAAKQVNLALITLAEGQPHVVCGQDRVEMALPRHMPAA